MGKVVWIMHVFQPRLHYVWNVVSLQPHLHIRDTLLWVVSDFIDRQTRARGQGFCQDVVLIEGGAGYQWEVLNNRVDVGGTRRGSSWYSQKEDSKLVPQLGRTQSFKAQ